jgi:hypothetical protein
MVAITDVKANTSDPDCAVTLAYPRFIAVYPAVFKNEMF